MGEQLQRLRVFFLLQSADQRTSVTSYRQRCQKFGTFLSAYKYLEWNFGTFP
jgi:hypothetical protein